MRMSVSGKVFILIMFCMIPFSATADDTHYNNILIGDRAAGMGGAYNAVSDDPSGLYYNPAGIIHIPGRSFSASVNAFEYSTKRYSDVLGGEGWERTSSNLLPNYFGIIQPLGRGKAGFSYAVPDSTLEEQAKTFYNIEGSLTDPLSGDSTEVLLTKYAINLNNDDKSYNFGPSYAIAINKRLSIGATAYIHYRNMDLISNQTINIDPDINTDGDEDYQSNNVYSSLTEWGLKPLVGIMYTPADRFSLGVTFSKTFITSTERTIHQRFRDPGYTNGVFTDKRAESDDNRELPWVTTVGAAYFPSDKLLFSADISYYTSTDYEVTFKGTSENERIIDQTDLDRDGLTNEFIFVDLPVDTSASPEKFTHESVINAAIGAEYYPVETIALRAGIFTNMSNSPDLSSSKFNQPEQINMYGMSASISRFSRASSITFGGSYSIGSGDAQVVSGSRDIQDADMDILTLYISAATSY